jgi:hypothetical protein
MKTIYCVLIQLFLNCSLCLNNDTGDESSVSSSGYITQTQEFCIVSPRYISLGDDLVDVSKLVVYNRLEVDEKLFLRPLCCDVSFWIKDKTVFDMLDIATYIKIVVLIVRHQPIQVNLNILLIMPVTRGITRTHTKDSL